MLSIKLVISVNRVFQHCSASNLRHVYRKGYFYGFGLKSFILHVYIQNYNQYFIINKLCPCYKLLQFKSFYEGMVTILFFLF